jgi:hypothetical protein
MSNKKQLTAEEIKKISEEMKKAVHMDASSREVFIAQTLGDVYDEELPIPEVIDAVSDVRRVNPGEHVYYLAPDSITKTVNTLTSDCTVVQEKVTPNTRTELSFTDLISKEEYVCIHDWLKGDHDVLKFHADAINEAMNRQEIYAVLQLLDAGATGNSNTYTLDTGDTALTFPKLVEMVRSVAKYGRNLVLITGANITTDVMLMDYNANTFRDYGLEKLNIRHIPIESLSVDINATPTDVIDADTAYLVAVSDSKNNKPVLFARRKLAPIAASDTTVDSSKERAVIDTGNMINVGSNRKFARGKAGFEEYGAVLLNSKVVAKFSK